MTMCCHTLYFYVKTLFLVHVMVSVSIFSNICIQLEDIRHLSIGQIHTAGRQTAFHWTNTYSWQTDRFPLDKYMHTAWEHKTAFHWANTYSWQTDHFPLDKYIQLADRPLFIGQIHSYSLQTWDSFPLDKHIRQLPLDKYIHTACRQIAYHWINTYIQLADIDRFPLDKYIDTACRHKTAFHWTNTYSLQALTVSHWKLFNKRHWSYLSI